MTSPGAAGAAPAMRYGYFGPAGTFTEMALRAWTADFADEPVRVPFGTVDAALAAVREGSVDGAMVPIENSVEGGVTSTLDALANGDPLIVTAEVLVPITFVLAAPAGTSLESLRAVGTHSHAWAQVRHWMGRHVAHADYVTTLSTAAAARDLGDPALRGSLTYQGAICAPIAAATHGLQVLAEGIADNPQAVTRFALVSRPGRLPARTGRDKSTVVLYQNDDHPGGLLSLLEQFATRGVNLTRLESRPTGEAMGRYCFSIDVEGHIDDARVAEALMGLHRVCAQVLFLGSYPRADGVEASVRIGTTDDDFAAARDWLTQMRGF